MTLSRSQGLWGRARLAAGSQTCQSCGAKPWSTFGEWLWHLWAGSRLMHKHNAKLLGPVNWRHERQRNYLWDCGLSINTVILAPASIYMWCAVCPWIAFPFVAIVSHESKWKRVLKKLWALFWLQASFVASPEKRSGWSQHKQRAPQPWCYRCLQIMGIKQDVVGKCNLLHRASPPAVPEPQEHTLALRTLLNRRWNLLRMNHSCALSP